MSVRARTALCQGFYYIASGLWPLFDLPSFEAVTGPKTDDWLVYTVAALLVVIGASLIVSTKRVPGPGAQVLGMGSAAALFAIDTAFVRLDVISPIFLLDALLEAALFIGWTIRPRRRLRVDILRRAAPYWRGQESPGTLRPRG